jgi:hypothetical protein
MEKNEKESLSFGRKPRITSKEIFFRDQNSEGLLKGCVQTPGDT